MQSNFISIVRSYRIVVPYSPVKYSSVLWPHESLFDFLIRLCDCLDNAEVKTGELEPMNTQIHMYNRKSDTLLTLQKIDKDLSIRLYYLG